MANSPRISAYIVESRGVDVNLTPTYHFHRPVHGCSKIEKASLFFAASACYLDIVRYLARNGAIVSVKTSGEADSFADGLLSTELS